MKQKNALILAIVWLLVMVSIVASTVTLLVSGSSGLHARWVSGEEYEMLERYARLEQVRRALSENYFQEFDDDSLITGAIQGMMASLEDPYTFYYTPDEMTKHTEETEGAYHGVGLLVQGNEDGQIEIIRVYADAPADRAGAQVGDLILKVDGRSVSGATSQLLNEAVDLMKGEDGSLVALTVARGDELIELRVERGDVSVSNVSFAALNGGIGYINIFQFTGDAVPAFETALEELNADELSGLIIDLRNNPGGILDDVVAIADRLLPEGCIVYMEDRAGARTDYYSDADYLDVPLVVLINDMSASASEILAAAVQDFDRGTVVGTRSYGKGVVQTIVEFEDDGAGMQYTSASYFTPSGASIHGSGVLPDLVVEATEGYASHSGIPDLQSDAQLRAAADLLSGQGE